MNFREFKDQYQKEPVVEFGGEVARSEPAVTVKVVTYNHAGYIAECLDSILRQKTDFCYQVLIAEDESSDGTREICRTYAERYPDRVRLLLNSRKNNISVNGKPTGFFNSVYANFCITSPYIAMIEGDDYWTDDYSLQKRYDFLQYNRDYSMCYHSCRYYDMYKGEFLARVFPAFENDKSIPKNKMILTGMPTSTVMLRNGLVENFEEGMKDIICGDVILRGKLCQYGKSMYLSDIKPSVYRLHAGGIHSTLTVKQKYEDIIAARLYLLNYYEHKQWDPKPIHESLSHNYWFQLVTIAKSNKQFSTRSLRNSYRHSKKGVTTFSTIVCQNFLMPLIKNKLKVVNRYLAFILSALLTCISILF